MYWRKLNFSLDCEIFPYTIQFYFDRVQIFFAGFSEYIYYPTFNLGTRFYVRSLTTLLTRLGPHFLKLPWAA